MFHAIDVVVRIYPGLIMHFEHMQQFSTTGPGAVKGNQAAKVIVLGLLLFCFFVRKMKMLGFVQTCHLMLDALLVLNNMSLRLQEQDCSCEVDEMMQNTTYALDKFKTNPRPNLRKFHPTRCSTGQSL